MAEPNTRRSFALQHTLLALLMCTSALGLQACASTLTPMQVISFRSPEITTNGSLVARQVRLSRQNQQTVNGLLQIQMTLESKKKHDVELEYRFRWFNSSGLEVKTAMSEWRTLVVEARQIQPVAAVAPDATCSDYIFEVRFPGR